MKLQPLSISTYTCPSEIIAGSFRCGSSLACRLCVAGVEICRSRCPAWSRSSAIHPGIPHRLWRQVNQNQTWKQRGKYALTLRLTQKRFSNYSFNNFSCINILSLSLLEVQQISQIVIFRKFQDNLLGAKSNSERITNLISIVCS